MPTFSVPPPDGTQTTIGTSVEGLPIFAYRFGSGGLNFYVMSDIHGNESTGGIAIDLLLQTVAAQPLSDEILATTSFIFVPHINPDGVAHNTRTNAHHVNLNRNFPARNFIRDAESGPWPASEPETQALVSLLAALPPAGIISIHEPLHMVDPDGPVVDWEWRLAAALHLPVSGALPAYSGSLGSYMGVDAQVPTCTLEVVPGLVGPTQTTYAQRLAVVLWSVVGEVGSENLPPGCLATAEVCDGIDNDCNGVIDDGITCP